jgi:hypothetical protein
MKVQILAGDSLFEDFNDTKIEGEVKAANLEVF